jgi:homoserine O-succinyltransferase
MATLALEKNKITEPYIGTLEQWGVTIVDPNQIPADQPIVRTLIVDPMPLTSQASVQRNLLNTLAANPKDITIVPDILALDVEVDKETAAISGDKTQIQWVQSRLNQGHYDSVIALGGSFDHVDYDRIEGLNILTDIFDSAARNAGGTFGVCLSSMIALHHFHGVEKRVNGEKIIGVFDNKIVSETTNRVALAASSIKALPTGRLGFLPDDQMKALADQGVLEILAHSTNMTPRTDAAISLMFDPARNFYMMAPHPEYGGQSILREYKRDLAAGGQGGIVTPEPIGDYDLPSGPAPWFKGSSNMFAAFLDVCVENHARNDNAQPSHSQDDHAVNPPALEADI